MRALRWWRRHSQADRLELYMLLTLYSNVLVAPLVPLAVVGTGFPLDARSVLTGAVAGVHTVLCVLLMRAGIAGYLGRRPRPTRLVLAGAASAVVASAVAVAAYPDVPDGPAVLVLLMFAGLYAVALTMVIRSAVVILTVGGAAGAAAFALGTAQGSAEPGVPVLVFAALLLLGVPGYRVTLWTLGMVRELERAREVQAGLAVAEERLRFARDLHDVLGRTLSVVALKAELSARLAERGRAEAVGEMLEVRQIAQDAQAELRAVVGGYRAADLAGELAGARALLASAGVACRIDGDGGDLPTAVQGTLGWVVREGTTNVLRHSEARDCTITLRVTADAVTLAMDNDGLPAGTGRFHLGNGLVGLTERITALGGTVTARLAGADRFSLVARLPVTPAAADGGVAHEGRTGTPDGTPR
jgi:two-component system sensor histidine kinase DesK